MVETKNVVKKTVGRKKAEQLVYAARDSVGVDYVECTAKFKIQLMMNGLLLINRQLDEFEIEMGKALEKTKFPSIC